MKKKIVFSCFSAVLALLGVVTITSCGNNSDRNWGASEVKENLPTTGSTTTPVVNPTSPTPTTSTKDPDVNSIVSEVLINDANVVDKSYVGNGLVVVKNSYNHVGFYSLIYKKYVVNCMFNKPWLRYTVTPNAFVGYVIDTYYDGVHTLYDSFGNVLYKNDYKATATFTTISGTIYSTVKYKNADDEDVTKYYAYTTTGTLSEVTKLPTVDTSTSTSTTTEEDPTSQFGFGEKYVDVEKIDLKDYGKNGYYLSRYNTLYTLFKEGSNDPISTFNLPKNATPTKPIIIGDYLLYQVSVELPDHSGSYSYSKDGVLYSLVSKRVNFLTGNTEDLNLNYVIDSCNPYKSSKGVYEYGIADVIEINNNKALSNEATYIIKADGSKAGDASGFEAEAFIKLDNSYYNQVTKVLYTSELKEIAYIGGMKPELYEDQKIFIGKVDGLYGAIDFNGRVVIPFEYTTIERTFKNYNAIGLRAGKYYRVNYDTGNKTYIGDTFTKLAENLYQTTSKEFIKYLAIDSDYKTFTGDYSKSVNASLSYTFDKAKYFIGSVFDEKNEKYSYLTFDIKKLSLTSITENGSEVSRYENIGDTKETAIPLTLNNKNNVYVTEQDGNYFTYQPSKDAVYSINFNNTNLYVDHVEYYDSAMGKYISVPVTKNDKSYSVQMSKNYKYYYVVKANSLSSTSEIYGRTTLLEEVGQSKLYPQEVALSTADTYTINTSYEDTYVTFKGITNTRYNITLPTGYNAVDDDGYSISSIDTVANSTYTIHIKKTTATTNTASLKLDPASKATGTIYSPFAYVKDEKDIIVPSSRPYYLTFKNTKTFETQYKIKTTGSSVSMYYGIDKFDIANEKSISNGGTITLAPNESLYLIIKNGSSYNDADITFELVPYTLVTVDGFKAATVSFNTNGGSYIAPQYLSKNNTALTVPADPVKTGYMFAGWYSDSSLSTPYTFSGKISSDKTLYAKWIDVSSPLVYAIDPVKSSSVQISTKDTYVNTTYYLFAKEKGSHKINVSGSSSSAYDITIYNVTQSDTILPYTTITSSEPNQFETNANDLIRITIRINSKKAGSANLSFTGFNRYNSTAEFDEENARLANWSTYVLADTLATLPYVAAEEDYYFDGFYDSEGVRYTNTSGKLLEGFETASQIVLHHEYAEDYSIKLSSLTNEYALKSDTNILYVEIEALETIPYLLAVPQVDGSDITYYISEYKTGARDTITKIDTTIGTKYKFVVRGSSALDTIMTITADTTGLTDGLTRYNPISLTANEEKTISYTSTVKRYYKFTNTIDGATKFKLAYNNDFGSPTIEASNVSFEDLESVSANTVFDVESNGSLYVRVTYTGYSGFSTDLEVIEMIDMTLADVYCAEVKFNTNGGTEIPSQIISEFNPALEYPETPTKENAIFMGWYTDNSYSTEFKFDEEINNDITLFAKWYEPSGKNIAVDVTKNNSSSKNVKLSLADTSSTTKVRAYFKSTMTGTAYLYMRNLDETGYTTSYSSYKFYYEIYDVKNGTSVKSSSWSSSSYDSISFSVTEGSMYYISFYRAFDTYSPSVQFYFYNFTTPTAKTSSTEFVRAEESTHNLVYYVEYDNDDLTVPFIDKTSEKLAFVGYFTDDMTMVSRYDSKLIVGLTAHGLTYTPYYVAQELTKLSSNTNDYAINVDSKVGIFAFEALETIDYDVTAPEGIKLLDLNGEEITKVEAKVNSSYAILVVGTENLNTTITLTPDTTNLQEGESRYLPKAVEVNTETTISSNSRSEYVVYYKYTNNIEGADKFTFTYDKGNSTSVVIEGSNESFEDLKTLTSVMTEYDVAYGESIYIRVTSQSSFEIRVKVVEMIDIAIDGEYYATVTFDSNGGSPVASQNVSNFNKKLSYPTDPTKKDAFFQGWYKDAELTEKYDFTGSITEDFTLYAKWLEVEEDADVVGRNDYTTSSSYITIDLTDTSSEKKVKVYFQAITDESFDIFLRNSYYDGRYTSSSSDYKYYYSIYNETDKTTVTTSNQTSQSSSFVAYNLTVERDKVYSISFYAVYPSKNPSADMYFEANNTIIFRGSRASYSFDEEKVDKLHQYVTYVYYNADATVPFLTIADKSFVGYYLEDGSKLTTSTGALINKLTTHGTVAKAVYAESKSGSLDTIPTPIAVTSEEKTVKLIVESRETISYNVSVGEGYKVYNDQGVEITTIDGVELENMILYILGDTAINTTVTFTPILDDVAAGASVYKPLALTKDSTETSQSTEVREFKYYTYTNASETEEIVHVSYNLVAGDNVYVMAAVGSFDDAIASNDYFYTVPAGAKLCIEVDLRGASGYEFNITIVNSNKVTLAGVKKAIVTFDSQLGSAVPSQTLTPENNTLTIPSDPTRNGYLFTGWYLDRNEETSINTLTSITSDVTLYAGWAPLNVDVTKVNPVTYNAAASSYIIPVTTTQYYIMQAFETGTHKIYYRSLRTSTATTGNTDSAYAVTIGVGTIYEALGNGVANTADYQTLEFTVNAGDYILFALENDTNSTYAQLYFEGFTETSLPAITLDANIGDYYYLYASDAITTTVIPHEANTVKQFIGFYDAETDGNLVIGADGKFVVTTPADFTVYARYEDLPASITVTYMDDTSTHATYTLSQGDKLTIPANPTKSGYVFAGWCIDQELTTVYDFNSNLQQDTTLYAKYISSSYTGTYSGTLVDPTSYTSSSNYYSQYLSSTNYIYVVANETGTHRIYYRNATSSGSTSASSNYGINIAIYNETQGTTIKSSGTYYSSSFGVAKMTLNKGDVVRITIYNYYYSCNAQLYFIGFTSTVSNAYFDTSDVEHEIVLPEIVLPDYDVSYTSTYHFTESNNGTTLTSSNAGVNSSTSDYSMTFNYAGTLTFNYSVSSEATYDKLYVYKNGSELYNYSGSQTGSKVITIAEGDIVRFTYSKDSSQADGSDKAIISNLSFTKATA